MTDSPETIDPDLAEPELAEIIAAIGRQDRDDAIKRAVAAFGRGLDHPLILLLTAEGLEADGRLPEALGLLRKVTVEEPDEAEGWRRFGGALARQGHLAEAMRALEAALAIDPNVYWTLIAAGGLSFRSSDLRAAEGYYRRAANLAPEQAEPLAGLAAIAARRDNPQEARALAERALAISPVLGAEMAIGRADFLDGAPERAEARMSRLLSRMDLDADSRIGCFDLRADARDAMNRPADAFADYTARNEILRRITAPRIETELTERRLDQARRLLAYFSAAPAGSWRVRTGEDTEGARFAGGHVFLVGFPRSGTTLLEKTLAGHPGVVSLEEVDHLGQAGGHLLASDAALDRLAKLSAAETEACRQAYWRGVEASVGEANRGRTVIDKLPLHTTALPLIAKLFPNARILFALRDPRDVVLSCFRRRFQINAAMYEFLTLDGAAHYYDQVMELARLYRALLPIEVFEVRHEAMVADFDGEVGKALAFIGLDWDPAVKGFAARARERSVTPSDPQLARGLNADGVGQWRRYGPQLASVQAQLEPWALHFGYPAAAEPDKPAAAKTWGFGFQVGQAHPAAPLPGSRKAGS
jgi:tetratricopeptide (TPR) repeat protein